MALKKLEKEKEASKLPPRLDVGSLIAAKRQALKKHSVAEANTAPAAGRLDKAAQEAGFQIERTVVEAQGLCPECQPDHAA